MRNLRLLLSIAVLITATGICQADPHQDIAKENAQLKQRVERLEKELEQLKRIVMKQAEATKPEPKTVTPTLSKGDMEKILVAVQQQGPKKKGIWSELDIQAYGNIRVDAAYNNSRMADGAGGSLAKWVESDVGNKKDDHFNITARRTRMGIRISGPESEGLKTSGVVEIDFSGSNDNESANHLRMRLAYLKLNWPEQRFSILAGQDWDTISPLTTPTINASVGWWTGNIGFRRPQIRLTKSFMLAEKIDLKLETALARTTGLNPTGDFDTPDDAGEDAGIPGFQGRASFTFPLFGPKPTALGISGHWAKEELDVISGSDRTESEFDSWSVNLDFIQPISKWLTIKGELFTGENLSSYQGGIGQGVRNIGTDAAPVFDKEIGSQGGWIAATLGPWGKWKFNVGAGVDDVDGGDVSAGDRTQNRSIFGNAFYSFNKKTLVGFELSQWCTEYKGSGDAESIRAQTVFIYKF